MIKVYKYTIICISFIMFLSAMLYTAFESNTNQVYASNKIEIIEEG